MLRRFHAKRVRHLGQQFSQMGCALIKGQQFLANHRVIKSAGCQQLNQVIHGNQWQPVLGATWHGRQLALHQVAYQRRQGLSFKDMAGATVAAHCRGVDNGHLPALGRHDLQGRKMRLQLACLITTDLAVDGGPVGQLRTLGINADVAQMRVILQHVAADHHQTALLFSGQQRYLPRPLDVHCA
ncbi:hypothetical protein D9M71_490340 [compost metagenome]